MSTTWPEKEKAVARAAFDRAASAAEKEIIKRHAAYPLESLDDLWNLEQEIRKWRKEHGYIFQYRYSHLDECFGICVRRNWLTLENLRGLGEERLQRIRRIASS